VFAFRKFFKLRPKSEKIPKFFCRSFGAEKPSNFCSTIVGDSVVICMIRLTDRWKLAHPESVREYREQERRVNADMAILEAARRRDCYPYPGPLGHKPSKRISAVTNPINPCKPERLSILTRPLFATITHTRLLRYFAKTVYNLKPRVKLQ
jgi:hypothetical protein